MNHSQLLKNLSMNYKKYVLRYATRGLAAIIFGLVVTGCTKNFDKYNTSNLNVAIDMASAYKHIAMAVYNFSGGGDPNSYQLQQKPHLTPEEIKAKISELETEMLKAAGDLAFERAAELRDEMRSWEKLLAGERKG